MAQSIHGEHVECGKCSEGTKRVLGVQGACGRYGEHVDGAERALIVCRRSKVCREGGEV
jgi:hypothetical protein